MATALVPLAEGFEEIEALSIVDVLRRGGVEVVTASVNGAKSVKGAHAVTVEADMPLADAAGGEYDAIVLPGGGEGTENLKRCDAIADMLRRQKERGGLIAAVCAAPTVLVAAGVVDPGVHMTCYPSMQMELDRPWAAAPVVEDGGIVTGQGPGCSILFALVTLKSLCGEAVAHKVARGMVADFA